MTTHIELNKVLVVYKKSLYDLYKESSDPKIKEYVIADTEEGIRLRESSERQKRSLEKVIQSLNQCGINYDAIYRADLIQPNGFDLVISVGGDGTFFEVSRFVRDETPVFGINSDPKLSKGIFTHCSAENFEQQLIQINEIPKHQLYRLHMILNGTKIEEPALNDILIAHKVPAAGTRYSLEANGQEVKDESGKKKQFSNYGLLINTAAGSTGAAFNQGGEIMPLDSRSIQFYHRRARNAKFHFAENMKIFSRTREGKIYVDGEHMVYDFSLGSVLEINTGIPLTVVGDLERKRKGFLEDYAE